MSASLVKGGHPYRKIVHLIIGIAIGFLISRIPGPGGITPLGMALIGAFLVANYWFIAIDMITGSLGAMILFVLLAGSDPAGIISGTLGNTTVWQVLIVLPLIYGLRVNGVTDALANWMMTRKILYGRSTMFVIFFLLFSSLLCALKVNVLVVLALAEGVMSAAGYEEQRKEHDAFLVATFFAGALAYNIIPYGSWIASFVTAFENIAGIPLDGAVYMLFGVLLNVVLDILYAFVMIVLLRCDFSRLAALDQSAMKTSDAKFTKQGKFMFVLFLVMIVGAVLPTLFSSFPVSLFINKTLTMGLWFTLCLVVALIVPIDGKPVLSPVDCFKNGVQWPLILSAGVMLYFSGIIGGDDAGIKAALSGAFSGAFNGIPGIALLLVACLLTVIITGFFSNMATGVIFMSATIPLAAMFNLSPLVLGVCIMWASMPGFITPGGTGLSPYLHGLTTITKKNMYKYMLAFLALFLVVILIFGVVMNLIF